jgi:hypothetical protein
MEMAQAQEVDWKELKHHQKVVAVTAMVWIHLMASQQVLARISTVHK